MPAEDLQGADPAIRLLEKPRRPADSDTMGLNLQLLDTGGDEREKQHHRQECWQLST